MHADRPDAARSLLEGLWSDLDGADALVERVKIYGPLAVLASPFDVTGFATACVGAASAALAELVAVRTGGLAPEPSVDRLGASASFRFDGLMAADGWELPPIWDPIAGDYRTSDGWIRLHTNYRHHLDAALRVLDVPAERDGVAAAVAGWRGEELEAAIIGVGGCAAVMRTEEAWQSHPAGVATAAERPVTIGAPVAILGAIWPDLSAPSGVAPLAGIRVLDLTRVIAGPVATRLLAAYGAEVLRIDPPGFAEVPALLPEVTAGKRCAHLDLTSTSGRDHMAELVAAAHVVVGGLRPGALERLGLGPAQLRAINPSVIAVTHDAYGWSGPWAGRRGFDSLVQMSTGIAAAGAASAGTDRPTPLPAQALDHGVGHLLAAATCRALTRLVDQGATSEVRGSLIGASNVIRATRAPGTSHGQSVDDAAMEVVDTAWGLLRHVPIAPRISDHTPHWSVIAGPLGRHPATFASGDDR